MRGSGEEARLEVVPEPSGRDREVLARAVRALARPGRADGRSAWWREGVRENVEPPNRERPKGPG